MTEQKLKPTGEDVAAYLAGLDDRKREDSERLVELMEAATGEPPALWHGGMVGFGSYHYRYASGHEGDAPLVAFAPRARAFTLYLACDIAQHQGRLDRLGKHKTGKGCLYVTRLSDIDEAVLGELIEASVEEAKKAAV